VAELRSIEPEGESIVLKFEAPEALAKYIAKKGSLTLDGISLTVNDVDGSYFWVNIIPHTATETIIGTYQAGTSVNIEVDLVARYLERLLESADDSGISKEFLRAHGYG